MIVEPLTNAEKLHMCINALAFCFYRIEYDRQCGYGERAKDNRIDIIETLQAVAPDILDMMKKKVQYDLFNGVDTNAGRNTDN